MTWQNYADFPGTSDREAGLYLWRSSGGRDDFGYLIKRISDGDAILRFECRAMEGRYLSDEERIESPGFDYLTVYHVVDHSFFIGEFDKATRELIEAALAAWVNNIKGYAFYIDGIGKRSLSQVKFIKESFAGY